MTLILSIALQGYVVQVSDRRLTWISGPSAGSIAEDNANKSVLVENLLSFGYTGLAQIDNLRSDVWLTRVIAKSRYQSISQACYFVRDSATETFQRIALPAQMKRHAFVAVGWSAQSNGELNPVIVQISNALDHNSDWLSHPEESFSLKAFLLQPNQAYLLHTAGQEVDTQIMNMMTREIKEIAERNLGPLSVSKVLVNGLRAVASKHHTVGKSLLVTSLPRPQRSTRVGALAIFASMPNKQSPTFQYLPENADKGIVYGPNFVAGDAASSDFRAGPL